MFGGLFIPMFLVLLHPMLTLETDREAEAKEPAELPYNPVYCHQYWFIDIRYLVRFEGKQIYSICIIEGVSRTILAGMVSLHQDEIAILQRYMAT